jgi:hypothetical protein
MQLPGEIVWDTGIVCVLTGIDADGNLSWTSLDSLENLSTGELTQRITRNPTGGGSVKAGDFLSSRNRMAMERKIPLPYLSQGPVDGFPHVVPVVRSLPGDDPEKPDEHLVRCALVADRKTGHQRKCCALDILFLLPAPFNTLSLGQR